EGIAMSHMAMILAAYIRTAAEYPYLNRFVGNKKVYAHKDFAVSMVVMRPGTDEDTFGKIYLDYTDTIYDVQDKIAHYVDENKKDDNPNPLDKAMKIIKSFPGCLNLIGYVLRFMDRHGLLPKIIVDASPFHASLLISNLASIRTNHIYHHVYEFGTTSVAITMGNSRIVPKEKKGEIVFEKTIPLGVVMDERICGGHDFAKAFTRLKQYLAKPELLEVPPEFEIKEDR
ncbi:MAG: 2-oxo acid dehydrogenase subunit E2, partial [Firmicutes bacterium]|nr:2-oxo acid dehydrogenase subunit E2 [Bacillota bacterium]